MNLPLAEMLKYDRWATLRLIEDCRGIDDAVLDSHVAGATGTIRELLLHVAGGQQTFALRTQGRQHEGEFTRGSAWPGWDALIEGATAATDDLIRVAAGLETDAEVRLPWAGKVYRYPRSFFLVHTMEHGGEHRAEIRMALRTLGFETRDPDGWEYAAAMGYGAEA